MLAISVLMMVLQLSLVNRQCLWGDEIFSLAIATGHSLEHPAAVARPELGDFVESSHALSVEDFRRYLKHENPPVGPVRVVRAVKLSDSSPPLYYLLLYGWTLLFGTSDAALRICSVVFSLACLPFLAGVARRTGGDEAVVPACLLFAISPLSIYYGTEGRMYSLLLLCIIVTAWLSLVLRERGKSVTLYLWWSGASAAGFLTHYFFLFPWLAMVTFLIVNPGQCERRRLLGCILLTGCAIAPWYLTLLQSAGQWRVTQGWLKLRPNGFNRARAIRNDFLQFFSAGGSGLWTSRRPFVIAAMLVFAAVAAIAIIRLRLSIFNERLIFLGLWFVAACAAPAVIDLLQDTYVTNPPRYALGGLPAAYLLAAVGFGCVGRRTRLGLLALLALAWAPAIVDLYQLRSRTKEDPFRELVRTITPTGSHTDLVLVHSIPSGVIGVARYLEAPMDVASWVARLGTRKVPESLTSLAAGRSRILLLKVHNVGELAPEENWLRENASILQEMKVEKATLIEFRPKAAETF